MSTWEERMAAKAAERRKAAEAAEEARIRAEMDAEYAEAEERARPVREAGPPGGCRECWSWAGPHWPGPMWVHGDSIQPGPPPDNLDPDSGLRDTPDTDWCHHPCHGGEPVFCAPVGYA